MVPRRWEKENKHTQAACWLVFTEQHKQAIDMLMRSKGTVHSDTRSNTLTLEPVGQTSRTI